jgi:hypothetical protein
MKRGQKVHFPRTQLQNGSYFSLSALKVTGLPALLHFWLLITRWKLKKIYFFVFFFRTANISFENHTFYPTLLYIMKKIIIS